MIATGIVRKIDALGRIVIPQEIRRSQEWPEGTSMEFLISEEGLLVRKYSPMTEEREHLVAELNGGLQGKAISAASILKAITYIKQK